jgi:hypothetical protein
MKIPFYLLLIFPLLLCSQNTSKPNFKKIELETFNKSSKFYYQTLENKFHSKDSILTKEEYYYFVYGSPFQNKKTNRKVEELELDSISSLLGSKTPNFEKLLSLSSKLIKKNPFNIDLYLLNENIYEAKGLESEAVKNKAIFNSLMETIKNSGDGKTAETAYYLIPEFNLITNYQTEGYSLKNNTRINNDVYKLDFEKNDGTKLPVFIKYSQEMEEIIESRTVNEQFITGKWKVTKIITEKKLNEQDKVLMDLFNDAIFTFASDKKFTFSSKIKNVAIQKGLLGELNGKKWKFNKGNKSISIGTEQDKYTIMGLKTIYLTEQFYFIIDDFNQFLLQVERVN